MVDVTSMYHMYGREGEMKSSKDWAGALADRRLSLKRKLSQEPKVTRVK